MCKVHHKPHYCELLGLLVGLGGGVNAIQEIYIMGFDIFIGNKRTKGWSKGATTGWRCRAQVTG